MQQPAAMKLTRLLRTLVLWTLFLPTGFAEETTANTAILSRSGPERGIVDIVPVMDAPPLTVNINIPVSDIHHHPRRHAHKHIKEENEGHEFLVTRSSSSSSSSVSFPTAFDTSLSNNFTSESCPEFFKKFLSDSTFTDCHAISTLLRDSIAFFHTLSSAASTSHVLDIACSANVKSCTSTMSSWASNLLADNNCGRDYANGNPLVTNAYLDMITYEPFYRATCLQNPDTTDYCFVDAVTNTSNPADYDVYLLPYGSTIASAPFPTCNACLQATLDVFSQWAQVNGQPLANSYLPSAVAANRWCDSDFANVNITVAQDEKSRSAASAGLTLSFPLWVSLSMSIFML